LPKLKYQCQRIKIYTEVSEQSTDIPEVAVLAEGHHFRKNCVVAEFESIINRING